MTFRIGQKVECVDASAGWIHVNQPLQHGRTYTVAAFDPSRLAQAGHETFRVSAGVRVSEVAMPRPDDWFRADRFRAVVESKTGFAMLTALLKTKENICQ